MKSNQFIKISEWQRVTFGKANVFTKITHLLKEIIELKEALISINKKPFNEADEDIKKEFADCFILLYGAADSYGMDYNSICKAIDDKMKVNLKRKWGKVNKDGTVNHVK